MALIRDEIDALLAESPGGEGVINISVHSNQLRKLPAGFGQLDGLRVLDLSNNLLQAESLGVISNLVALETLNLTGNPLITLPPGFCRLVALKHLKMSVAGGESGRLILPADIGALSSLEDLDVSASRLEALPDSFCRLSALAALDLGHNSLETLPQQFGELRGLQNLVLIENHLAELPDSFCALRALTNLDLSGNRLTVLPDDFGSLVAMRTLDLTNNQLEELPESFCALKELVKLSLAKNRLSTLPDRFGELVMLSSAFGFDSNRLTRPPPEVCKQGVKAIGRYFELLRSQGGNVCYFARWMLVGYERVGKTTLAKALRGESFDAAEASTDGLHVRANIAGHCIICCTPSLNPPLCSASSIGNGGSASNLTVSVCAGGRRTFSAGGRASLTARGGHVGLRRAACVLPDPPVLPVTTRRVLAVVEVRC